MASVKMRPASLAGRLPPNKSVSYALFYYSAKLSDFSRQPFTFTLFLSERRTKGCPFGEAAVRIKPDVQQTKLVCALPFVGGRKCTGSNIVVKHQPEISHLVPNE